MQSDLERKYFMSNSILLFILGGSAILNAVLLFLCYGLFSALIQVHEKREQTAACLNDLNRFNEEEPERTFVASAGKRENTSR